MSHSSLIRWTLLLGGENLLTAFGGGISLGRGWVQEKPRIYIKQPTHLELQETVPPGSNSSCRGYVYFLELLGVSELRLCARIHLKKHLLVWRVTPNTENILTK